MKKTQKLKTEWNLKHFYKGITDPQIQKDVERVKRSYDRFAKTYNGRKDYLTSVTQLVKALHEYERLMKRNNYTFTLYLQYVLSIEGQNTTARALANKIEMEMQEYENKITFFRLALGSISKKKQKIYLKDRRLERYHELLRHVFDYAKYQLTEKEEKILSLKSLPAHDMWEQGVEKLLSGKTIRHKGKQIPISQAANMISNLPTKERQVVHKKLNRVLIDEGSDFAESVLNALYIDRKISDELRGFKKPYEATLLSHDMDEKTVLTLVETVTDNFSIARRFYAIKKKLLDVKKLTYADRNASIGKVKQTFTYEESYRLLYGVFGSADLRFARILERMAKDGFIDVYPKKGKRGGAFCSSYHDNPTFVFLNHVDTFDSLTTFAHEMGHAIHFELSKPLPIMYRGCSTAVAETASTLFEGIVFEYVFEKLTPKEQIIALHDRLNDLVNTIFRQIAAFNFELDLHNRVREEGFVGKEVMASMLTEHLNAYTGPAMTITKEDGYQFVSWGHFRWSFYVYSYAFGALLSMALLRRYKEDPVFMQRIITFLESGESKSPYSIFKEMGIDISSPQLVADGLKEIEDTIETLEALIKKHK